MTNQQHTTKQSQGPVGFAETFRAQLEDLDQEAALREYLAASMLGRAPRSVVGGSILHAAARQALAVLGPRRYIVALACASCGERADDFETTIESIAERPRRPLGLCLACAL